MDALSVRIALCGLLTTGAQSVSLLARQDRSVFRARTDLVRLDVVAAGLAPGGYLLRVSASEATVAVTREVGFIVR